MPGTRSRLLVLRVDIRKATSCRAFAGVPDLEIDRQVQASPGVAACQNLADHAPARDVDHEVAYVNLNMLRISFVCLRIRQGSGPWRLSPARVAEGLQCDQIFGLLVQS